MSVSLAQASKIIKYAPTHDVVSVMSAPGTGKSSTVVDAARQMGAIYWPVYAATYEAVDARGLPMVKEKPSHSSVEWAAPSCLPLALDSAQYSGRTILVNLDDAFQAPPPVLRAFVRTFYGDGAERKVGDFLVYPNVRFVCTGNREQDRAGVYRPETYVNDRLTYVEVEPSVDEWCSGAINGFAHSDVDTGYADTRKAIDAAVKLGVPDDLIAYVKWSKQCYEFSTEQRSFLSPRSIERLGRFIRAFDAAGINGDMLHEVAAGTIGEAQAVKLMAFRALRKDLPDIDAILRGEDVKLPARTEILYILCTSILRAAKKEQCGAVAKLINTIAATKTDNGIKVGVEISAYLFSECLRGSGAQLRGVRSDPSMMQWLQRHGKYFTAE